MKKNTVLEIVLVVFCLVILAGLTVYLTLEYKKESTLDETQAESKADALLEALEASMTEPESSLPAAEGGPDTPLPEASAEDNLPFIIWVGDSRTVGMGRAMDNGDLYIGADGEGYEWLSETGLPQLAAALAQYPQGPVVFNFGVNDCDNIENYLTLYQSLESSYPEVRFYYLSVNPIDPAICKNVTNEEIASFNAALKTAFPQQYIDSFTYLMVNETGTVDGVHYSEEDYRKIHAFAAGIVAGLS